MCGWIKQMRWCRAWTLAAWRSSRKAGEETYRAGGSDFSCLDAGSDGRFVVMKVCSHLSLGSVLEERLDIVVEILALVSVKALRLHLMELTDAVLILLLPR